MKIRKLNNSVNKALCHTNKNLYNLCLMNNTNLLSSPRNRKQLDAISKYVTEFRQGYFVLSMSESISNNEMRQVRGNDIILPWPVCQSLFNKKTKKMLAKAASLLEAELKNNANMQTEVETKLFSLHKMRSGVELSRLVFSIIVSNYHTLKAETVSSPQEWAETTAQICMYEAIGEEIMQRSGVFTTSLEELKLIIDSDDFIALSKFGGEGLTDEEKVPVWATSNLKSKDSIELIIGDNEEVSNPSPLS